MCVECFALYLDNAFTDCVVEGRITGRRQHRASIKLPTVFKMPATEGTISATMGHSRMVYGC